MDVERAGRRTRAARAFAMAAALTACGASGSPPAARTTARAAAAPAQQAPEPAREAVGEDDEGSLREARAERGLAISPVPLDTAGLTPRERARVGLGSYLVNAAGDCSGCHTASPDAFLAGGVPFFLGGGQVVRSRNLTPDPDTGLPLDLDQFEEALRTGRDFHPGQTRMLVVMPWLYLRWESEVDLEAIYAYLRAIPPVRNAVPPDAKDGLPLPPAIPFPGAYTDGDVVRRLAGDRGSFDFRRGLAIAPRAIPAAVRGERARAYGVGSYLANATIACNECHTHPDRTPDGARLNTAAYLTGGTVFVTPPPLRPVTGYVRAMSANLEGATSGFFSEPGSSLARFEDIVRSGALVDETPPRPLGFPMFIVAHSLRNLVEPDLRALYAYLDASPRTAGASDVERQPPARFCAAATDCRAGEACAAGECVGGACGADADCGACQTCDAGACAAPAATSACLLGAQ